MWGEFKMGVKLPFPICMNISNEDISTGLQTKHGGARVGRKASGRPDPENGRSEALSKKNKSLLILYGVFRILAGVSALKHSVVTHTLRNHPLAKRKPQGN